jgi:hypothetical protein
MRRWLTRFWNSLVYGGSTRLRSYEGAVLEALIASLGPSDAAAVRAQLAGLDHVKRLHRDRMVTFYFYQPKRLPPIENRGEALHVGAFRISGGSNSLTAVVFAHRGLLSSLEFTKAPAGLEHAEVIVEPVRTKGSGPSLATKIDRIEHGGESSSP